ncbi:ras-related protein Rab-8B-like isoform X2 [Dreissena polymorpha]|uniref:ras-related protein Rab-8B-like isoform X2 n=1 Tax=Dreissena polymorpha TaxID=45954 RepID=UPI002264CE19|nr:ras-related protein Rab-8B-like isoform X2 [Dreissena polymorpha]
MSKADEYVFKILLIGDRDVGKTKILDRFSDGVFDSMSISYIRVKLHSRSIELDGKIVKLQIWVSFDWFKPGILEVEVHPSVIDRYYKGVMGAFRDVEIMLLGNKCDIEDERQVHKDTGERFAAEHGMKFMEVSARASINIEEAFFTLARQIMNRKEDATGSDDCTLEDGSDELRPKNSCVVQ